jgi:hypothetical protein
MALTVSFLPRRETNCFADRKRNLLSAMFGGREEHALEHASESKVRE